MKSKQITWRCPANIALVKYWGKKENQIPCNASLSLTLQQAYTDTTVVLRPKNNEGIEFEYLFDGEPQERFSERISRYLSKTKDLFPVLKDHALQISSANNFPHSAGIASSASFFGSLALALLSASDYPGEDLLRKASTLARMGSGSACRSLFGGYALWGKLASIADSSDSYAVPVGEIHPDFRDVRDAILIIDSTPKSVSSSQGHALMEGHRYAQSRFQQANDHCAEMIEVLRTGDFKHFSTIIEQEALALHAMMMTSEESYILMKPDTVWAIDRVRSFRKKSGLPVCFTLDAGPNVHLIYSGIEAEKVQAFLEEEIHPRVKDIIYDRIGSGPKKLTAG